MWVLFGWMLAGRPCLVSWIVPHLTAAPGLFVLSICASTCVILYVFVHAKLLRVCEIYSDRETASTACRLLSCCTIIHGPNSLCNLCSSLGSFLRFLNRFSCASLANRALVALLEISQLILFAKESAFLIDSQYKCVRCSIEGLRLTLFVVEK